MLPEHFSPGASGRSRTDRVRLTRTALPHGCFAGVVGAAGIEPAWTWTRTTWAATTPRSEVPAERPPPASRHALELSKGKRAGSSARRMTSKGGGTRTLTCRCWRPADTTGAHPYSRRGGSTSGRSYALRGLGRPWTCHGFDWPAMHSRSAIFLGSATSPARPEARSVAEIPKKDMSNRMRRKVLGRKGFTPKRCRRWHDVGRCRPRRVLLPRLPLLRLHGPVRSTY